MSNNITELNATNFVETISAGVTLVDYWAVWCGPCKMLAPVLEQVAEKLVGTAKVCKVNVDDERQLAVDANVSAIPNLCIYKDGVLVDRIVGVQPLSKIVETVNKYL